jgi:hypothetical protein
MLFNHQNVGFLGVDKQKAYVHNQNWWETDDEEMKLTNQNIYLYC